MLAHSSPTLIAACHVLHRLYMPRHPRIALTSRLRVHTTNDSAGNVDQQIGDHSANAACMMRMILSQLVFIERTDPCGPKATKKPAPIRHRFEKPIHNVKDGLRSVDRDMPRTWCAAISLLHPWKIRCRFGKHAYAVDGGAYRDRTDDLMLAKQPLSQLS
jgi:hypothetical protein